MNFPRPLAIAVVFILFQAGSTKAQPPWRPQLPATCRVLTSPVRPALDDKTHKRFESLYRQGLSLLKSGQYRQAQPLLDKAIQLNPDHAEARRAHARTLLTLGYLHWNSLLVERALIDVNHAIWLAPKSEGLSQLSELLRGLKKRMDLFAKRRK